MVDLLSGERWLTWSGRSGVNMERLRSVCGLEGPSVGTILYRVLGCGWLLVDRVNLNDFRSAPWTRSVHVTVTYLGCD